MTNTIREALEHQLARRLDCTVCGAVDAVKIELGSNSPGDVLVWRCGNCGGEWFETGQPRSIPIPTITNARRDEILRKNRAQVTGEGVRGAPVLREAPQPVSVRLSGALLPEVQHPTVRRGDPMTASLSPDCKAGKCRACSGDAWDHDLDGPMACPCECHRPKRVQMSRQHPWRAENPDAVIVARPSRWGNPVRVKGSSVIGLPWSLARARFGFPVRSKDHLGDEVLYASHSTKNLATEHAVAIFRIYCAVAARDYTGEFERWIGPLRGHDLVCWCPLPAPGEPDICHAAVLLELAATSKGTPE